MRMIFTMKRLIFATKHFTDFVINVGAYNEIFPYKVIYSGYVVEYMS